MKNFKKNLYFLFMPMFKNTYNMNLMPTPFNINWLWNSGSIIGLFLIIQILSGFFMSMFYNSSTEMAFSSISHIMLNINNGWLIRIIHMNGASFFFIFIYMHIGRGLYYYSYKFKEVWILGVIIFLLSMMTAFMGYVLPWGQMSFWGATVITNLLSAIPYIGNNLVKWLWGGFSVSSPTLSRFYSLHFIMPLVITVMVFMHIFFLHLSGSNNYIGIKNKYKIVPFNPYFIFKDILGYIMIMLIFLIYCNIEPYLLGDPDNFIKANPMVTPVHIKPEWYFLFAYTILRVFSNKLAGVLALLLSILILIYLPYTFKFKLSSIYWYPMNQLYIYTFFLSYFMLTWLGGKAVEYPYVELSKMFTMVYFSYFFMYKYMNMVWDGLLLKTFL